MKALKPPAHDQDNYFFDVLSNCSRHLGLRGLARVAASSKQLGHSCTTIITRDTLQLALAEVEAAQQFAVHLQESEADFISGAQDVAWPSEEAEELYAAQVQHLQDLVRLLQLKPAVAEAAQVIDSLLHVSMVPDHVAVQLVAAGVRITYVQLLGAANSMVEDVEVWVQAQEQLGITTDIPPAAVAVRMNNHKFPDDWDTLQLPADDVAGLLQLAMNSSYPRNRQAASTCLPAQLSATAARHLLLTAAVRQCKDSVIRLASSAAIQQHVDAGLLQKVLGYLPESCVSGTDWTQDVAALLYEKLPTAAAALRCDAVFQLLDEAVCQDCWRCVFQLCRLPAAEHLSKDEVMQLLEDAIEGGSSKCVEVLCRLPAAGHLSSDEVMQLLVDALEVDCSSCFEVLCRLPAAGHLSSDEVMQLLEDALEGGSSDRVEVLCRLPAAQQLSIEDVSQLLEVEAEQAVRSHSVRAHAVASAVTGPIQMLLGEQQQQRPIVFHLLPVALPMGIVQSLERMAQVASMQGHAVVGPFVTHLLSLPAARQFWCAETQRLQHVCMNPGTHEFVGQLYALRLADDVTAEVVEQLLHEALHQGVNACLQYLCQLPAASRLGAGTVSQLITHAEQHNNQGAVKLLSSLWEADLDQILDDYLRACHGPWR